MPKLVHDEGKQAGLALIGAWKPCIPDLLLHWIHVQIHSCENKWLQYTRKSEWRPTII